jgi:uncharacterized protein
MNVCFYHSPCSDGTACAWIFQRAFKDESPILLQYSHESDTFEEFITSPEKFILPPSYSLSDAHVYFLDVCPSFPMLQRLSKLCRRITVIDHHKSALDELKRSGVNFDQKDDGVEYVICMDKAASQLTWSYFNPNEKAPWFIDFIADRDLWKWEIPFSSEVNSALFYKDDISIEGLENLMNSQTCVEDYVEFGKAVNVVRKKDVEMCASNALRVQYPFDIDVTFDIWLCQAPRHLRSEIGNYLASKPFKDGKLPDFAALYFFDSRTSSFFISVRNIKKEGCVDLSIVSKRRGGGGHMNAAGFSLKSIEDFNQAFRQMSKCEECE